MNQLLVLLALLLSTSLSRSDVVILAAGDALQVYDIAGDTGTLTAKHRLPLPGAGSFTFAPGGKMIYAMATNEDKKPAIANISLLPNSELQLNSMAPVNLRTGSLKLDPTGNVLAGNHYKEGKASTWLLTNGQHMGERFCELALEEKAHCAVFSPDGNYLLVPATGPNKVFINRFDPKTGNIVPHNPAFASGHEGEDHARSPRHLVFHPMLPRAYTTMEREAPGVAVWEWNAVDGTLNLMQDIITYPKDFDGQITTADVHITPDAQFLYVSNRDGTKRGAPEGNDSIVGFSIDHTTGKLTLIGHFPCERVPRSFCIDESGQFLYVAGQGDDRLGVYKINVKTGSLTKLEQHVVGARPVWVSSLRTR
jgi:6-phosphogluconolactonase